jgi:hypothetical protein
MASMHNLRCAPRLSLAGPRACTTVECLAAKSNLILWNRARTGGQFTTGTAHSRQANTPAGWREVAGE